ATQDAILNFVMGAMFIILPMLWVTAIGWAGISVGSVLSGLQAGTDAVGKAGARAGDLAETGIKTVSSGIQKGN
ncbi:UNVERIFIED_CONTAM: conjugal transfer protein TraG, partial [Pseudomonas aeruginosa]